MKSNRFWIALFGLTAGCCFLTGQAASNAVIVNSTETKWTHDAGDPPGSESILLRQDVATGGMELLVRFPAGHVIAPHWHESNERIMVIEGRLSLKRGDAESFLDGGGYAFLPAREVQNLSCVSKTRCGFYLGWDGKPNSRRGTPPAK